MPPYAPTLANVGTSLSLSPDQQQALALTGLMPPRTPAPTGFRQPRDIARLSPGDAQSEPLGGQIADWVQGQTGWRPGTTPSWMPQWARDLSTNITTGTEQSKQDISDLTKRVTGKPMTDEDWNALLSLGMTIGSVKGVRGGRGRAIAPKDPGAELRGTTPEAPAAAGTTPAPETLAGMGHNLPPEPTAPEPTAAPKSVRQNIAEAVAAQEGAPTPASPRRSITSTSLRTMPLDEATALAENGVHLKQDAKTGQFVGAPRGFTSMDQIEAQRDAFDNSVKMGMPGRVWYDESQEANRMITRNDPARMPLLASEQAYWSPQATPDTNFGQSLLAHNAYEVGAPLDLVKTTRQGIGYREARDVGQLPRQGPKTGPFMDHLNPLAEDPTTGVNDIWHARANGFTNPDGSDFDRALTAQEHAYLDGETVLATKRANDEAWGGHTDWTPGRVQAAGWVGKKTQQIMEEEGKSYEEALAIAQANFKTILGKYTGAATYEQVPGAKGHLEGLKTAPYEERLAYHTDPLRSWEDPQGEDILYKGAGFYSLPTRQATGYFKPQGGPPEINPLSVARPLMSYSKVGTGGGLEPASATQRAMDAIEGFRALTSGQNMGAYSKVLPQRGPVGGQTAVFIPHPRALTPDEMTRLGDIAGRHNLTPVDTGGGEGVSLQAFGGEEAPGPSPEDLGKLLKEGGPLHQQIAEALPEAGTPVRGMPMGNAIDLQSLWEQPPGSGAATRKVMDLMTHEQIPALVRKIDTPEVRQAMANRVQAEIQTGLQRGEPVRPDLIRLLRVISTKGIAGVLDEIKRTGGKGFPAIAGLGLTGLGMARAGLDQRNQQR